MITFKFWYKQPQNTNGTEIIFPGHKQEETKINDLSNIKIVRNNKTK